MNKDARLVEDIMEALDKIEHYVQDIDEEEGFVADSKTQDAVLRNLEIIGEASKGLSREAKEKTSGIDWRRVAGMRDKIIHDYAGVDARLVWRVVEVELPKLRAGLKRIQASK